MAVTGWGSSTLVTASPSPPQFNMLLTKQPLWVGREDKARNRFRRIAELNSLDRLREGRRNGLQNYKYVENNRRLWFPVVFFVGKQRSRNVGVGFLFKKVKNLTKNHLPAHPQPQA